jgi:UDP-N-acetylglucosamine 2-epimerase (non-hydrolysing)
MKILHVVGARPNFMKAAPVVRALEGHAQIEQILVHTGQHYDSGMSEVFFKELGMPRPNVNLGVGSGSHACQTSAIISRFEPVVLEHKPDVVVVYGDVNSTVASALVCAKLLIPVAHVEAGLRSFDRTMPEEINRLLTDQMADVLFTPSPEGNENLLREGIEPKKIQFVGNVMIDTLIRLLPRAHAPSETKQLSRYALVTLHRPSNVDEPGILAGTIKVLERISQDLPVLFPVHPRTRERLETFGVEVNNVNGLRFMPPISYLQFLALQRQATVVITDSGGIQEETTFLGVPCLTLRENTERPVTVSEGTNILIGRDPERLRCEVDAILAGRIKHGRIPHLWDGKTGERIAKSLAA